jgi:DNA-binding NtrC family response regulator
MLYALFSICSIRILYKEELEDGGYHVLLARNEWEALGIMRKGSVDLVIMEYQIEQTEPYKVLLRLAREIKNIPVIICTGYPRNFMDDLWWGEIECLLKSSNLDNLKDKIREMLDYKGCFERFYATGGKLQKKELYL